MTNDVYSYRLDVFVAEPVDVTGFDVEATDGHIGKVDEATFDAGSSCLVVDTGFWIFGKRRMLPAGTVNRVDVDERTVHVALTKDQVKDAPDFDAERHADDPAALHAEQADYYRPFGY